MESHRNPVIEMARSVSASFLGKEFDEFLYAPIGEDRNGMLLSVLSALARLDIDPWQEAAKLARLPGEAATRRLTALLATLPAVLLVHLDPGMIAARLVALLPRQAAFKIRSRAAAPRPGVVINSRTVLYVIFIIFVLGAQWVMASRRPSEQVDNVRAPAASTVLPATSPPVSRQ